MYKLMTIKAVNSFSVQSGLNSIRDFGLSCIFHFIKNGNGEVLHKFMQGFSLQQKYKKEYSQAVKAFGFDSIQLLSIEANQPFQLTDKQKSFLATMRLKIESLSHFGYKPEDCMPMIEAVFWDKSIKNGADAIKLANECLSDYQAFLKEKEAKEKAEAESKAKAKAKAKAKSKSKAEAEAKANVAVALPAPTSGEVLNIAIQPAVVAQLSPDTVKVEASPDQLLIEWASSGLKHAVDSVKLSKVESDQLKTLLLKLAA